LKTLLERTDEAMKKLQARMKEQNLPDLDENGSKEFLAKCLMETVNRFIF